MSDPAAPEGNALQVKPFAQFLQQQERGTLHDDLSSEMQDLAKAVLANGRPGTLTLTIKLKPTKTDGALEIEANVKVKKPETPRSSAFWFPDADGNLHRDDPRQMQFTTVREAPAPAGPVRETPTQPNTIREMKA